MEMEIDKQNDVMAFNEKEHKYWVKGSDKTAISVTTLIEKYGQPFNSDFWSSVKALQELISIEEFDAVKSDIYKKQIFNQNILKKLGVDPVLFMSHKNGVLEKWKQANTDACEHGTYVHKMQEIRTLNGDIPEIKRFGDGGEFVCYTDNKLRFGQSGAYPEILIHYISEDQDFRLAGQADLILINGNSVTVLDFKTNKEIKKTSYFNNATKKRTMMKFPLSNLMDCNYYHYAMQLSTYAWMIQKIDSRFKIQKLAIIHIDQNDKKTIYELPYYKDEVERMLNNYMETVKMQKEYDKNKPIEY